VKAVLDTNVLVSGLLWRGAPYRCLLAAQAGLFDLAISQEIMDELARVLTEKFHFTDEEVRASADFILRIGRMAETAGSLRAVKDDPDDDKFLETALAAEAQVIVSGDHHLIDLKEFRGIRVLKPSEFLDQVLK
jgi:putative PIN family toxin of toxin-antitoxin system